MSCLICILSCWLALTQVSFGQRLQGNMLSNGDSGGGELVFVSVVYRHGNRTVLNPYPNDPYKNASFWPEGWGQLTKTGMLGHYDLGRWLRQRYNSLLPAEYNGDDIYVQSTDVDRTLMSAYCNLAGLYEPTSSDNWSPNIIWRPIPVHTVPAKEDDVLIMSKSCPRYDSLLKKVKASDWYQNILKTNNFLLQTLSDAAGKAVNDLKAVEYLYDTLYIETLNGLQLPVWTQNVFPEPMKELAMLSFTLPCHNQEMARLKMGPFVKELIANLGAKVDGSMIPDRKMFMYSAHDTTVANILLGLQLFNGIAPPYFSTIIFELRKQNDQHFVQILYKNSTTTVYPLTLPGCVSLCPFEKFVRLLQPITIKDRDKECRLALLDDLAPLEHLSMWTSVTVASFLILVFAAMCLMRRKPSPPVQEEFVYHSLPAEAT